MLFFISFNILNNLKELYINRTLEFITIKYANNSFK